MLQLRVTEMKKESLRCSLGFKDEFILYLQMNKSGEKNTDKTNTETFDRNGLNEISVQLSSFFFCIAL